MTELKIIGLVLMIFGFAVRSQMISQKDQKYGMKILYILCILFFGFTPILGLVIGFFINVINFTELHYSDAIQTNKFVLWLYNEKLKSFFDKIYNFFNKRVF